MVLMYTAPAWVALASRFLFHESISRRKLAGIGIALVGAMLIGLSGGSLPTEFSSLGIACGFISGLAYASHFPFLAWFNTRYSTATIYTYMLLGGGIFMLPFASFPRDAPADGWWCLLALSLLTTYAAYVALA